MLLRDLPDASPSPLIYLENFVNDGSPSGFSTIHVPPPGMQPGTADTVLLDVVEVVDRIVAQYGHWCLPSMADCESTGRKVVLVHPAALEGMLAEYAPAQLAKVGEVEAWLTASGRTFVLKPLEDGAYAKLHYPGILGRVRRELPLVKALAGFEVSCELERFVRSVHYAGILRETGFRSVMWPGSYSFDSSSWSCIMREAKVYPYRDISGILIPVFSLFGADSERPSDPTLVVQFCEASRSADAVEWLLEELLVPLVRCYLAVTFDVGVMPELNAQNVLFEYDGHFRVVLRDMSRMEKLLHVRRRRDLSEVFASLPYKGLDLDTEPEFAKIRHSFSFDFKFSTYVIDPLITALCDGMDLDVAVARKRVRDRVKALLAQDPYISTCFPEDGDFYGHPKKLLTSSRPYVRLGRPLFR